MMSEPAYDIIVAREAQEAYCNEHELPRFAPSNGECHSCGRNIYSAYGIPGHATGISVEDAGARMITSCPHCNRSFCD